MKVKEKKDGKETPEKKEAPKKKEKKLKQKKPPKPRVWGLPLIGLLVLTLLLTVMSLILTFVAFIVAMLVEGVIGNFVDMSVGALLIVMSVVCILAIAIINSFLSIELPDMILPNIYRQGRTVWFILYFIATFGGALITISGVVSNAWELELFTAPLVNHLNTAIASFVDSSFGEALLEEMGPEAYAELVSPAVVDIILFLNALFYAGLFLMFVPNFINESCMRCGRAYIMDYVGTSNGGSRTRAEFEETSGYWRENKASVSVPGQLYNTTVTYDTYVPGKTEFKGVYRYTDKTTRTCCPLCHKEKTFYWTSRDKLL